MMELLRQWLVGITCAAMIVSLADSLTPKGTVRKIGRVAGGLVLLIAVVKPLMGVDFRSLALSTANVREAMAAVEDVEKTDLDLMKTIIGERTGAYILDKAEGLGAGIETVTVRCEVGQGNVPYPAAVIVAGTMTEDQRKALSRIIEADLAIPKERQTYESGDGES